MIKINTDRAWDVSVFLYIVCSVTFLAGPFVKINSISLYFFLLVSAYNVLIRRGKLGLNLCLASLAIYGVFLLTSLFYTPATESEISSTVYDYVTMLIIVWLMSEYAVSYEKIDNILHAILCSGVTLSAYIYSLYGNSFWSILRANSEVSAASITRIGSVLANTNDIGICTSFSVSIGLYFLLFRKNNLLHTSIYVLTTTICFIMSMATGSKKALIIIFLTTTVVFAYHIYGDKNAISKIKYISIPIFGVVALYLMVMNLTIFSGIKARIEAQIAFRKTGVGGISDIERAYLKAQGIKYWGEKPIFGNGICSSVHYLGVYTHNNFTEILMNTGLIGFAIFYVWQVYMLSRYAFCIKSYKKVNSINSILAGFALSIFICGSGLVYYYDRYTLMLLVVAFRGMLLGKQAIIKENEGYKNE